MKKNKTATVFYLYGMANAGDAAIGLGTLAFLIKQGYAVKGVSRWSSDQPEFVRDKSYYQEIFPHAAVCASPIQFKREKQGSSILRYVQSGLSLLKGNSLGNAVKLVSGSELVVLNGGNLIRCEGITDFVRLIGFLWPVFLSRLLNVPYVILPQSTTRINGFGGALIKVALSGARRVWVREDISLQAFRKRFPSVEFNYSPDMAFHLSGYNLDDKKSGAIQALEKNASSYIAVTLRDHTLGDLERFDESKQQQIQDFISAALSAVEKDVSTSVAFVVQCDKDEDITDKIINKIAASNKMLAGRLLKVSTRDTVELIEIYRNSRLLIGMRLHGIILALSAGTPCIGFFDRGWGLKNPGILGRFGQPAFYLGEDGLKAKDKIETIINVRKQISDAIMLQCKAETDNFANTFASGLVCEG